PTRGALGPAGHRPRRRAVWCVLVRMERDAVDAKRLRGLDERQEAAIDCLLSARPNGRRRAVVSRRCCAVPAAFALLYCLHQVAARARAPSTARPSTSPSAPAGSARSVIGWVLGDAASLASLQHQDGVVSIVSPTFHRLRPESGRLEIAP